MDSDLRRRWERAERHLRAALAEVDLPGTHGPLVADFVEHNELGLAFEWTVEVIANSELELTKEARRHLSAAAAELGLRANRDWRRLEVRD
ncbi:MAG: MafI family immunity protein [Solirubrobacteraceae bacterium]